MKSAQIPGQLLSLGSINADFQVRAERWPDPGETLVARDFLAAGGGKGANAAYMAHRFGAKVRLIGHVGADRLREQALATLQTTGMDLHQVRAIEHQSTGVATIVVRPDGNKTIILAANANDVWSEAESDEAVKAVATAPAGSVLIVDLEVPRAVAQRVLAAARDRGFRTILDPSPAERLIADLYPLIDCITPNSAEARHLTGVTVQSVEQATNAGRMLVKKGVSAALVKLGSGGCALVTADRAVHVPSFPAKAVDTTGAGDAFAGALGAALLEGRALREAARVAVAAASLAVTGYGAQASYPMREVIERLL